MTYKEFVDLYCQDLVNLHKDNVEDSDRLDKNFIYDDLHLFENGEYRKVVYAPDGTPIPIVDILRLYPQDFLKEYPDHIETYNKYIDKYEITVGIEAILAIRKRMEEDAKRVSEISKTGLDEYFDFDL